MTRASLTIVCDFKGMRVLVIEGGFIFEIMKSQKPYAGTALIEM